MDRMKQTIEEAEESQPLLAQELYDSYRQASQDRLQDQIDETNNSLRRGFVTDARQLEESAREGLNRLREDIEQATENILAGEADALRRARDELNDLASELNEEINRSDDRGQRPSSAADAQQAERRGEPQQQGQPADGNQAESGQQPSSPGQPQQDQNQQDQQGQGQPTEAGDSPQTSEQNQKGREPSSRQQPSDQQPSEQAGRGQPNGQGGRRQDRQQADDSPQRGPGQPQDAAERPNDNQSDAEGRPDAADERSLRRTTGGGGPRTTPRLWGDDRPLGPLTGNGFRDWSDRLRDVEEMISDPELKSDAARIRDRAQQVRKDLVRHSQQPNWELVRMSISQPLVELRDRISQELQTRESKKALVPIDRDPVPAPYAEQVRRYYERLGSGR
jgi:hypothetical protein